MIKPKCPTCHSDKNVIILGIGFRCAYCNKRFFKSDLPFGTRETQAKLVNK